MKFLKKSLLPVAVATIWISLSEFARNEFLLKNYWIEHYQQKGLIFPSEPVNGAIWGLWSVMLAILIFQLIKKFSFLQTALLSWLAGFVMMWLVIGNLGVLPYGILIAAVPLSILEILVAAYLIRKLT